uniref:Succinate dehydrogenase assembly factor 3 n=1 Tax=Octactis speculum TaxID=3111310 RepID=A0A7S2G7W5_9STRA|mmetsp:Transcript_40849/g.55626  ORF Transcript_40849/g.55626 Transcript_40849/m.55626 type:complete len:105 (+) Transcript_40849:109-423(+)|eukprot:CAMPEP_0185763974 /NCGR_PEP_ID=MMETSP1174-20130828/22871_1 /TAXON_ID=35687 /ORGANISM="Dictyocha speculum, Strain CCMP1381" /LENGTH=104 /DNA_ID=CAMNT_0028446303 /DNA_START=95 /DNA_END=409 /DNA_ORIENTATION=-
MSRALSLYRSILRGHRTLPAEMRELGDKYVRSEFRQHQAASPEFLETFFSEWEGYLETLQTSDSKTGFGRPLGEEISAMTDEQKQMLLKLAEETRSMHDHENNG